MYTSFPKVDNFRKVESLYLIERSRHRQATISGECGFFRDTFAQAFADATCFLIFLRVFAIPANHSGEPAFTAFVELFFSQADALCFGIHDAEFGVVVVECVLKIEELLF